MLGIFDPFVRTTFLRPFIMLDVVVLIVIEESIKLFLTDVRSAQITARYE